MPIQLSAENCNLVTEQAPLTAVSIASSMTVQLVNWLQLNALLVDRCYELSRFLFRNINNNEKCEGISDIIARERKRSLLRQSVGAL